MKPGAAQKARAELGDLHALRSNRAWRDLVQPMLEEAANAHTSSLADRNKTAEKRGEHIEAYHLAVTLRDWLGLEIAKREKQLQSHEEEQRAGFV